VRVLPHRASRSPAAILAVGLALSAIACHPAERIRQQALDDSAPVSFSTRDGTQLAGRLFGPDSASAGVVLVPMAASDQSAWFDFADRLGHEGYRVLTFDPRGVCPGGDAGCSKGTASPADTVKDVQGAVAYLRSGGVTRIGVLGAGLGGTATLVAASQAGSGIDVVITLSALGSEGGVGASASTLQTVTAAKLFLAGSEDPLAAQAAQAFYDASLPPKEVQLLTTADHGTNLLTGGKEEIAANDIIRYLTVHLPVTAPGPTP
jgi:pimeloyl-ACP methyl ester carboxylesterase